MVRKWGEIDEWFKETGARMVERDEWFKELGTRIRESEIWFKETGVNNAKSCKWFKEHGAIMRKVVNDLKKLVWIRKMQVKHRRIAV